MPYYAMKMNTCKYHAPPCCTGTMLCMVEHIQIMYFTCAKKGRQINIPHLRTNHYTTLTSTQASCGFIVEFTQVQSEIFWPN